jgi:hypothetical protein
MRSIKLRDARFWLRVSNVTGNEILKKHMYSGDWIIVIEGYTFAWMRTFAINAGPQQTLIQTPTAIFNITKTPVVTTSTTSTAQWVFEGIGLLAKPQILAPTTAASL